MKKESKVANSSKGRKDSLNKLLTLVLFSISLSTQMLIVSSTGILVNRNPSGLSIVEVLCNRYGANLVKDVRKLEKICNQYGELQLDLDFLQTCQHSNAIPKCL